MKKNLVLFWIIRNPKDITIQGNTLTLIEFWIENDVTKKFEYIYNIR